MILAGVTNIGGEIDLGGRKTYSVIGKCHGYIKLVRLIYVLKTVFPDLTEYICTDPIISLDRTGNTIMIWEFWAHLEGPAATVRAPLINANTKEPVEFDGELLDALVVANDFIVKYKDNTLITVNGIEIIPKGRGKYLQYPSDEYGRLEIKTDQPSSA